MVRLVDYVEALRNIQGLSIIRAAMPLLMEVLQHVGPTTVLEPSRIGLSVANGRHTVDLQRFPAQAGDTPLIQGLPGLGQLTVQLVCSSTQQDEAAAPHMALPELDAQLREKLMSMFTGSKTAASDWHLLRSLVAFVRKCLAQQDACSLNRYLCI